MLRTVARTCFRLLGFESRIARNSVILTGAEIIVRALNMMIGILLFRYLGPERAGIYRFVVSYGILFAVIGDGGISRPGVRTIARSPREQLGNYVGTLFATRALLSLAMIAILAASLHSPLAQTLPTTTQTMILLWCGAIVFQTFRKNAEVVFQALQDVQYHAMFLVLNRGIALLGQIVVVLRQGNLFDIMMVFVLADAVDAIWAGAFIAHRYAKPTLPRHWRPITALLTEGFPFAVHLLCQQLRYYLDAVLLKYLFRGAAAEVNKQIGLYASAMTFVTTFIFLPNSLLAAVFPELARSYVHDRPRFRSLACDSLNLLFLIGGGIAVAIYTLRHDLVRVVFGKEYAAAVPMLSIAVWAIPLLFLTAGLSAIYAAGDRQGFVTTVSWIATASKLVLSYLWLPQYGGLGAGYVMLGAETLLVGILTVELFRWERSVLNLRTLLPAGLMHAAGFSVLCLWVMPAWLRLAGTGLYAACVASAAYAVFYRRRNRP